MKSAECERVGRKHDIKRLQVATTKAARNLKDRAKTLGAGAVSAAAGGATEVGRKAQRGAERVKGKLSSAKEKIKGFVQRVGRAAKAGYSAAKKEFSGEAGREAKAKETGRLMRRAARNQASAERGVVDLYDVVLEHLLDEGYADTEEAAAVIMANMSEEWREEILEAKVDTGSDEEKRKTRANRGNSSFMHILNRGMKKSRGKKPLGEPGKNRYSLMQHNKKQEQRGGDGDEQRRRDRDAMSRGT